MDRDLFFSETSKSLRTEQLRRTNRKETQGSKVANKNGHGTGTHASTWLLSRILNRLCLVKMHLKCRVV